MSGLAVPCAPGALGASVEAVSGERLRGPLPESSATHRFCAPAQRGAVRPTTTAGAAGTLTRSGASGPLKPLDRLHFSHLARARGA